MIPRYEPTYSYKEIHQGLLDGLRFNRAKELEAKIREYFQAKHAFLLNSGKTSLYTILRAYNRPGIVLMPAYNCNVVPEAVVFANYKPVFIDPHLQTLNVSISQYEELYSYEVTAIFTISLFGIPYDASPLLQNAARRNILVVEDAASAMGATINGRLVGTVGEAGVISFQATKPLSGETGGAIITNKDDLAQKIENLLSNIGTQNSIFSLYASSLFRKIATRRWLYPITCAGHTIIKGEKMYEIVPAPATPERGYFTKISPFSVELVNRQWDKFYENMHRRREIAARYREALMGNPAFTLPDIPDGVEPVWIQFPMLLKNKLAFYKFMKKRGVDTTWTYRYSCADEYRQGGFPNAETIARSIVSLPCYPDLTDDEVDLICQAASAYSG